MIIQLDHFWQNMIEAGDVKAMDSMVNEIIENVLVVSQVMLLIIIGIQFLS